MAACLSAAKGSLTADERRSILSKYVSGGAAPVLVRPPKKQKEKLALF